MPSALVVLAGDWTWKRRRACFCYLDYLINTQSLYISYCSFHSVLGCWVLTEQEKPARLRCWLETPPCLREMRSWTLTGGYNSYQTSHVRMVTGIRENRQFIYYEICVRRFLIKLEFGISGFRLPSSCTGSSQAFSVNAFRWRIETERPRLARTTWPETHRPRAVMIPRDYTRFLRSGKTQATANLPYPAPEQIEQRKEPATSSTQIWRGLWDSSPGRIGGRSHPWNPKIVTFS